MQLLISDLLIFESITYYHEFPVLEIILEMAYEL